MRSKRALLAVTGVVLGIIMIVGAFEMLDWVPYLDGTLGNLVQFGSLLTFVGGALVISKGLPF